MQKIIKIADIEFMPDVITNFLGRNFTKEDCTNNDLINFIESIATTKEVGYKVYENEYFVKRLNNRLIEENNANSNTYYGYSSKKDKLLKNGVSKFMIITI